MATRRPPPRRRPPSVAPSPPDAPPPAPTSAEALAAAEQACTNCDLYKTATQAVPGRGPTPARVMLVGEQPGDREDLAGEPFVGPAGQLLQRALTAAGLERAAVYLTNAVKHFKWEPRGKRRIHQTPRWSEIRACKPWLDAELAIVAPRVIVCLGAIAAKSLLGAQFRLTVSRGAVQPGPGGRATIATYHPSAVLRATDEERERLFGLLVEDLRLARRHAARSRSG